MSLGNGCGAIYCSYQEVKYIFIKDGSTTNYKKEKLKKEKL